MKAQEPALGIMKTHDFGHSIFYKIECQCGNDDDSTMVEIEADCDIGDIVVNTYVTVKTAWWDRLVLDTHYPIYENSWIYSIDSSIRSLINGLYHRINITYQVWIKGSVKFSHTILMSQQQALNYAETLKQSIKAVEKYQKENDENDISREDG